MNETRYEVVLTVAVDNPEAVYNAAVAKHRDVDPQTACEDFQDEEGEINIEACLGYLYDPGDAAPGTEIVSVSCEEE
ncbi:hypothetical protein [Burkholderia pseudomallei]|uniref:hypothetical protein n=1 Tax=Burkholderia pseudomallei TaxID=28450 RepID=UPI000A1A04DD|nr:hypothetical protein [Burkholderia pseudomallei]ARL77570.1 hypothetical protein BOC54_36855 [Burkholderia pseudomallei]ARL84175.1 hypothetical protein BOC55_35180 [Burkholderia pseudomallei]